MGKLLPLLLILIGAGAGAGAGLYLRPKPPEEPTHAEKAETSHAEGDAADPALVPEFVKLTNQFIVPVLEDDRIASLVILSLSVEVTAGNTELVFAQEPKLRDAILQLLFDHANSGGFRGSFTDADNLVILRNGLTEVATEILGDVAKNVLITDIIRQDA